MSCEVTSWIPAALATTLRDERSAPVLAWLTNIRASIEEYDPLITVRPPSPESDETETSTSSDSAFDEILSHLGKEIYKLEEYQRNLAPSEEQVSLSILDIFDKCLESMAEEGQTDEQDKQQTINEEVKQFNGDDSDGESTLSDLSFVTSTPVKSDIVDNMNSIGESVTPPVPKPRTKIPIPSSPSTVYDNVELRSDNNTTVVKRLESDSDSESTCWSYKECSTDGEVEQGPYAAVWAHASGYHRSDAILRRVLSQHYATISRISFDTASDFSPTQYSVYSLHEVGDRCSRASSSPQPVAAMTPDKPTDDGGYEPVRDAITDENIYEEIEYGYSYTDEGCSCGGSVEVESISMSASSEGVGRESPLYANLRDHDAYAVTPDVIFWKNLLLDPFYNDDEEDEWITPEECAVYSREQRPPLVIPRITQYRTPRREQPRATPPSNSYIEESPSQDGSIRSSYRHSRLQGSSPTSEKSRADLERGFNKASSDSPPFIRLNKRFGGSTENLLHAERRPNHLPLPASSSGDSLDVEVRDRELGHGRSRKSRSMVSRMRSPVPAPRMINPHIPEPLFEGPIKRTKFSESGKKCRKNWLDCYMILTPTALVFYKDQKTYYNSKLPRPPGTPPSPTAPRAELILPLRSAHVVPCTKMHTRRFTTSLVLTVDYDQYLLQDDHEEGAKRWLNYIQEVYYKLGPSKLDDFQVQYQSSNTDLESLGRTPPVTRHINKNNHKAGGSSNEDLSDPEVSKTHVKRRLRNFFAKRPAMDVLVKKGIYQEEPVFGSVLHKVCPPESPRVPEFVVKCIKEIESSEENMCTDGLYRASGNLSQVQKIRLEVDQKNLSVLENTTDIHVLTGSLKLFFRELKEPLIPCSLFDRVLAACSIKPREAKIKEFRDIVQSLPQCNRDTLKYLLEHLLRVTMYSEKNRMHTANLAIVFGPTILWAPAEQAHNIAIDCIQQNHVVEILLNDFKDIFEDGKSKKKT